MLKKYFILMSFIFAFQPTKAAENLKVAPLHNYQVSYIFSDGNPDGYITNFGKRNEQGRCVSDTEKYCTKTIAYAILVKDKQRVLASQYKNSTIEPGEEDSVCLKTQTKTGTLCKEVIAKIEQHKDENGSFDKLVLWTYLYSSKSLLYKQGTGWPVDKILNEEIIYHMTDPDGMYTTRISFKILNRW